MNCVTHTQTHVSSLPLTRHEERPTHSRRREDFTVRYAVKLVRCWNKFGETVAVFSSCLSISSSRVSVSSSRLRHCSAPDSVTQRFQRVCLKRVSTRPLHGKLREGRLKSLVTSSVSPSPILCSQSPNWSHGNALSVSRWGSNSVDIFRTDELEPTLRDLLLSLRLGEVAVVQTSAPIFFATQTLIRDLPESIPWTHAAHQTTELSNLRFLIELLSIEDRRLYRLTGQDAVLPLAPVTSLSEVNVISLRPSLLVPAFSCFSRLFNVSRILFRRRRAW